MTKGELRLLWFEVVRVRNNLIEKETDEASEEYNKKYTEFLEASDFMELGRGGESFQVSNGSYWFDLIFPDTAYRWDEPI